MAPKVTTRPLFNETSGPVIRKPRLRNGSFGSYWRWHSDLVLFDILGPTRGNLYILLLGFSSSSGLLLLHLLEQT
jgi:hypothetical protein